MREDRNAVDRAEEVVVERRRRLGRYSGKAPGNVLAAPAHVARIDIGAIQIGAGSRDKARNASAPASPIEDRSKPGQRLAGEAPRHRVQLDRGRIATEIER